MNETCDRCGPAVGAGCRIDRVNRAVELYLYGQCASRRWRAIVRYEGERAMLNATPARACRQATITRRSP